ncbi:hypothetical protein PYW07_008155 [Mythimna separata]|uniref:DUF7041 domain-containing protein n=1 Tax=Mythimna separata TaxID=271217 RepID=A0AAD8DVF9_MYTSE|nr:hypothetical protein PYW07_008155 [Mythimna separata]
MNPSTLKLNDGSETSSPQKDSHELSAVSYNQRIPPLWRNRIKLWFLQFEAIVSAGKLSDKELSELLIRQLDLQDLDEIQDIMFDTKTATENNRYATMKTRLIQTYDESDHTKLERLLSTVELGDLKPSQLLRRMQNLAGNNIAENTLRVIWTKHLPPSVRAILAVSETIAKKTELNELAIMADKMLEQLHHQISAVHNIPSPATLSTPTEPKNHENALLHAKIDMLAKEIAEIKTHHSHYGRQRGRNWRGAPRHRSRSAYRSPHGNRQSDSNNQHRTEYIDNSICYFHRKFGGQARKCTRPCTYEDKHPSSSGN